VIGAAFLAPVVVLAELLAPPTDASWRLLHGAGWLAAEILAYVAYVRLIERRRVAELSLDGAGLEWLAGAGLGALLMGLTFAGLLAAGAVHVVGIDRPLALVTGLASDLPASLFEELVFRALLFKICEERLGTWIALAIQAALFGALHLFNPGATLAGAVAVALEAGILLGGAYTLTRRLWLPWGMHFAWNYVQARVISGNVSGTGESHGLLAVVVDGPAWLTGGSFGAEASPIAVALCLALAGLVLRAAWARGQLVPR